MMRKSFLWLAVMLFTSSAFAQQGTLNPDRKAPLEITADESLEWNRTAQFFKARKNVKAVQGGTTLMCDVLTARYRDGKKSGMDIHIIEANGHVRILSAQSRAYGDKAIYDIQKGYAIMTGEKLRLISDDQTVYARDKFEYWVNQGRLIATGQAVAVRLGDKLEADKIITIFTEDKTGKRVLRSLEALGHVVITTPTEVLTGERALYKTDTNIAQIWDNVKITRGSNVLEGKRAQVNLDTNISKIFGNPEEGSRVRGVFFPGSDLGAE